MSRFEKAGRKIRKANSRRKLEEARRNIYRLYSDYFLDSVEMEILEREITKRAAALA